MSKRILHDSGFTLLELLIVLTLLIVIAGLSVPWIFREQARTELRSAATKLQSELYATRLTAMKSGEAYVFRYQGSGNVYEIIPKSIYDANSAQNQSTSLYSDVPVTRSVGSDLSDSFESDSFSEMSNGNRPSTSTSSLDSSEIQEGYYRKTLPIRIMFGAAKQTQQSSAGSRDDWSVPEISDVPTTRGVGGELSSDLTLETSADLPSAGFASTDFANIDPFGSGAMGAAQPSAWSDPIIFFPNGRTSNAAFEIYTTGDYVYRVELNLRGLTGTARIGEIKVLD